MITFAGAISIGKIEFSQIELLCTSHYVTGSTQFAEAVDYR